MSNIICPVSRENVNKNTVRLTALLVLILVAAFTISQNVWIMVFLFIDFAIRGFSLARFSPLSFLANEIRKRWLNTKEIENKGPKIFAARVGLMFSFLIALSSFAGWGITSLALSFILGFFAFLECGIGFCAGCYIYTYLIFPRLGKSAR